MKEFKVVVLGPGGVGKSAICVQFISRKFVEKYDPTVEDFYRKEIEVDGNPAYLEILDTAGTEQFASMRDLYIKNGQGFIIVYSLTSRQSFQDVKLIREQILRIKGSLKIPIILAANKCDVSEDEREVTTEEGLSLSSEWNIPYVETSAKNSSIVNCLFTEIVKEMNAKAIKQCNNTKKKVKNDLKKFTSLTSSISKKSTISKSVVSNESFGESSNSASTSLSSNSKEKAQQTPFQCPNLNSHHDENLKENRCSFSLFSFSNKYFCFKTKNLNGNSKSTNNIYHGKEITKNYCCLF